MFDFLSSILKHRHRHKVDETVKVKKRETAAHIASELDKMYGLVTDRNFRDKSKEFYALVRTAFREALALKYEATVSEIQDEINKNQHFNPALRAEINAFLSDVALMEYGYPEFKAVLDEKKHEQEHLLHEYIRDLEKEGEHLKADTKRKIAAIVSDNIPHSDSQLLQKQIEQFRPLLYRIL